MANWRATAHWSPDEKSTPWSEFLQVCKTPRIPPTSPGHGERPSKRRKTSNGRQSSLRSNTQHPPEGYSHLGSVSVHLEHLEGLLEHNSDHNICSSTHYEFDFVVKQPQDDAHPNPKALDLHLRPYGDATDQHLHTLSLDGTTPQGRELLLCISRLYNNASPNPVLSQAYQYLRLGCYMNVGNHATYWLQIVFWWKENAPYREPAKSDDLSLIWRHGLSQYDKYIRGGTSVVDFFQPGGPTITWNPAMFYESVHAPPLNQAVANELQSEEMDCTLYPFQKRAVAWMLQREGVRFGKGHLVPYQRRVPNWDTLAPPTFSKYIDGRDEAMYYSRPYGVLIKDIESLQSYHTGFSGGVLAEEMGLGKTIELISLICLHKRREIQTEMYDLYSDSIVMPSRATLIVTPSHILQQWITEINTHAPGVKVFNYRGMVRDGLSDLDPQDLLDYDIVLTTYNVLSKEIHYAAEAPARSLRHKKIYARRRSPLIQISWWRVCLDEAQLIESGVSQAATVARVIPRVNAWAVTGTPVKKNLDDLRGLLVFLRYEPIASNKKTWIEIERNHPKALAAIFKDVALRHSKSYIRHELQLPPQQRVVLNLPFSAIEEQYYYESVQRMCEECGFAPDGSPADQAFDADDPALKERMRSWVRQLRQICLYPRITDRHKRRAAGEVPLRTVAQVLETMMDSNESSLRNQERDLIDSIVIQSHILAFDKSNPDRAQIALDGYLRALVKADVLVSDCRQTLKQEQDRLTASAGLKSSRAASLGTDVEEDDETDDNTDPKKNRVNACRNSLRLALMLQHVAKFFVASAYYQLKENGNLETEDPPRFKELESLEVQFYDEAKRIRSELLHEAQLRAEKASQEIYRRVRDRSLSKVDEIAEIDELGGIENRKVLDVCDNVLELLNRQTALIQDWRDRILSLLQRPLVDQDEGQETTGDEYEDSTKVMDELYVYTAVLRAVVADRQSVLSGQYGERADIEMKEALRSAKWGEGHSPELMLKLGNRRQEVRYKKEDASLRGVVAELRELATNLQWRSKSATDRAGMELNIVEKQIKQIQSILTEQTKLVADLEKEQELYHHVMNQRVEFYRQLQVISDTVQPYKEELQETVDQEEMDRQIRREGKALDTLEQLRTKRRFLFHLRDEADDNSGGRVCVICTDKFETGVITVCGHQYCKDCIKMWWQSHRTCPVCKKALKLSDFHDITYVPQEVQIVAESPSSPSKKTSGSSSTSASARSSSPTSESSQDGEQTALFAQMNARMMVEIKSIDLPSSYGTKIDTLARHLIWLRTKDPGAKSIVFSQFSDFLELLSEALTLFKIGHVSIKGKGVERFRRDPGIEVALLDAKIDNSGLNLVNATHVFLFEPLINTALELQAIARVHRIGQLRMTHVYMYLVRDTVEEAVYDISVKRRLEHIHVSRDRSKDIVKSKSKGKGKRSGAPNAVQDDGEDIDLSKAELAIENAESRELEQASLSQLLKTGKTGGGEIVKDNDLWNILFMRPRIPQANFVGSLSEQDQEGMQTTRRDLNRNLRANAAEGRSSAS